MSEIDEDHPIYRAIDMGGGQTCDIRGVIRELNAAGFVIVPREPTGRMCNSGAAKWDDDWCTETNALNMWQAMIDEALK